MILYIPALAFEFIYEFLIIEQMAGGETKWPVWEYSAEIASGKAQL